MVRKRTIIIALLLAPTPVLCCCVAPVPQLSRLLFEEPGLTQDQLYRHERWIRVGMTRDEVKAVFGPPHQEVIFPDGTGWWYYFKQGLPIYRSALAVDFDNSDRVTHVGIAD